MVYASRTQPWCSWPAGPPKYLRRSSTGKKEKKIIDHEIVNTRTEYVNTRITYTLRARLSDRVGTINYYIFVYGRQVKGYPASAAVIIRDKITLRFLSDFRDSLEVKSRTPCRGRYYFFSPFFVSLVPDHKYVYVQQTRRYDLISVQRCVRLRTTIAFTRGARRPLLANRPHPKGERNFPLLWRYPRPIVDGPIVPYVSQSTVCFF